MTAHGERALMTFAQRWIERYERCPRVDPINAMGGETICGNCAFGVEKWHDHDWVHRQEEVLTLRRMAAGGPWVDTE